MRSLKNLMIFVAAFLPFFTAGAVTASFVSDTKNTPDAVNLNISRGLIQTTVLLYKQNDDTEGTSLPEAIDVLMVNLGDDTNLHIIRIYPTHDEGIDILILSDLAQIIKKEKIPAIVPYFENSKKITINGMIKYDDLAEKSIRDAFSQYPQELAGEFSANGFTSSFCENVQMLQVLFAGDIDVRSLYPKHINSSFDIKSRLIFKSMVYLANGDFTCQSFD